MINKVDKIKSLLEDVKASDIKAYDFEKSSPFFQYVIIATANDRQANAFTLNLKKEDIVETDKVEGRNTGWTLVDLGDIVVHIFDKEMRRHYNFDNKFIGKKQI